MNYNDIIYLERTKRHMTQKKLADKLNISRRTVIDWEHGKKLPGFDSIIALALIFNISTDYLLGLTNDPKPAGKRI